MTPNSYINSASPHDFPSSDHDRHHPNIFTSNTYNQAASSSSCIITRDFFNSSCSQDQSEYLYYQDQQLQQPQLQQHQAENLASQGASCETENEISDNGLKFCIWKQENHEQTTHDYQVKWMSSKMKKKEAVSTTTTTNTTNSTVLSIKLDDQDQKQEPSPSPMETDQNSSNSTNSSNSMISNMNPIRVCTDCSTTKTPLWRSGPQGPKSLCNACGIRQRKARRAIAAAAAAAANGTALEIKTTPPLVLKTKKYNKTKTRQQKDKTSSSCGHVANFKTRICNLNAATSTHDNVVEPPKKLCFEDFLLNLTNNLDYHQVFPQDEKDAAILLMALSWDHQAYNH